MKQQPTIRLETVGGLSLDVFAHREHMLYSALLLSGSGQSISFLSAYKRCHLCGSAGGTRRDLWLDGACIELTAESARKAVQFLEDTQRRSA